MTVREGGRAEGGKREQEQADDTALYKVQSHKYDSANNTVRGRTSSLVSDVLQSEVLFLINKKMNNEKVSFE